VSIARDRKEAAKRLGLALSKKYERLVTAGADKDEITLAAIDLGNCFNENIEFVLWVLKTFGGMTVMPPTRHSQKPLVMGIDHGAPGGDHSAEILMQDGKVVGQRLMEMPALLSAGNDVDFPSKKKH
jgi:hypothetical protein